MLDGFDVFVHINKVSHKRNSQTLLYGKSINISQLISSNNLQNNQNNIRAIELIENQYIRTEYGRLSKFC